MQFVIFKSGNTNRNNTNRKTQLGEYTRGSTHWKNNLKKSGNAIGKCESESSKWKRQFKPIQIEKIKTNQKV